MPLIQPSEYSIDQPRSTGMLLRLDRQGKFLSIAAAADAVPSASPSEVVGKKLGDVWPSEIAQRFQLAIDQALASGEQQELILSLTLRGRASRHTIRALVVGDDEVTFAVTETTEADERLERLRASEAEFRNLWEQSSDGISVIVDGRTVFANQRIADILGRPSPADLMGLTPTEFVVPEDREGVGERIRFLMKGHAETTARVRIKRPDGTIVPCEIRAKQIVYRGDGALLGQLRELSHPEDDESAQAVAIREARQALESAATHLPMGSEADVLAAKALATILRLENTQH